MDLPATAAVLLDALGAAEREGAPGHGPAVRARARALQTPSEAAFEQQRERERRRKAEESARGSPPAGAERGGDGCSVATAKRHCRPDSPPLLCGPGGVSFAPEDASSDPEMGPRYLMSAPGLERFSPVAVLSPEEALYLHREIFGADLYFCCGVRLPAAGRAAAPHDGGRGGGGSGAEAAGGRPVVTVVDAGANVGLFALRCAAEFLKASGCGGGAAGDVGTAPLPLGSLSGLRIVVSCRLCIFLHQSPLFFRDICPFARKETLFFRPPQAVEPGKAAFAALQRNTRQLAAAGAEVSAVRIALAGPPAALGEAGAVGSEPRLGTLTVFPR